RSGTGWILADLVLDLVDDALDVARQVGLAGQSGTPLQAAMVRRNVAGLRERPVLGRSSRFVRAAPGSRARTAERQPTARGARPRRASPSRPRPAGDRAA